MLKTMPKERSRMPVMIRNVIIYLILIEKRERCLFSQIMFDGSSESSTYISLPRNVLYSSNCCSFTYSLYYPANFLPSSDSMVINTSTGLWLASMLSLLFSFSVNLSFTISTLSQSRFLIAVPLNLRRLINSGMLNANLIRAISIP